MMRLIWDGPGLSRWLEKRGYRLVNEARFTEMHTKARRYDDKTLESLRASFDRSEFEEMLERKDAQIDGLRRALADCYREEAEQAFANEYGRQRGTL